MKRALNKMMLQKHEKIKKSQTKLWRLWLLMNYKFDTSYAEMTSSNSGGGKLCYALTRKTPQNLHALQNHKHTG